MIFVVIPGPGAEAELQARVTTRYEKRIQIHSAPGQWLIAADGTAKDVSDRLGISSEKPDDIGPAVVLAIVGYWGREPNNVWEWIAANAG